MKPIKVAHTSNSPPRLQYFLDHLILKLLLLARPVPVSGGFPVLFKRLSRFYLFLSVKLVQFRKELAFTQFLVSLAHRQLINLLCQLFPWRQSRKPLLFFLLFRILASSSARIRASSCALTRPAACALDGLQFEFQ